MKPSLLSILRCLDCSGVAFECRSRFEDAREIREGTVRCRGCGREYPVEGGILQALERELPEEVRREKEHAESFGYLTDRDGKKYPINADTLKQFRDLFLTLPRGDGSHFFQPGGSFDNQSGNAGRYFQTLDGLGLTGKERVLEVGASFGWSPWHFAKRGCEVVALDVTNYLAAADLYFAEDGSYFERMTADMSRLPFRDETFDIIFSHSVIHHCKDLTALFGEFKRVLRPGGRVVALHECAFGLWENKSGGALQQAIDEGFNENAYTIPEWKGFIRAAGYSKIRVRFFSFIEGYIDRKEQRGARPNFKLRLAYAVKSKPWLHGLLNQISFLPRLFFRPKAWMVIAQK